MDQKEVGNPPKTIKGIGIVDGNRFFREVATGHHQGRSHIAQQQVVQRCVREDDAELPETAQILADPPREEGRQEQDRDGQPVRVLVLDRLVHSYTSLDDPTKLVYGYEQIYAERRRQPSYRKLGVMDMPLSADEYVDYWVAEESIQMHGGIGMTDEFDAGFYLKRARALEVRYGNAGFHRYRYASALGF